MDDEDVIPDGGEEDHPSDVELTDLPGLEEDDPPAGEAGSSGVDYQSTDRAIEDWKDDLEARGRLRTDGEGDMPESTSSRRGCIPVLVLAFGVVVVGAFVLLTFDFDSDNDQDRAETPVVEDDNSESAVRDSGVDTADTADADDAADDGDGGDESATDMPDARVRPRSVNALIDEKGQMWIQITFDEGWVRIPPRDFFSLFWSLSVTYNPTVEVGWETHNGVETVTGATSEAYILDDGSVLVATGLFPTPPFEVDIVARFGSWKDETGPPAVFGDYSTSIDSDSIEAGDPFVDFGGEPVFDLVAGS